MNTLLDTTMHELFRRCPALSGFSVQQGLHVTPGRAAHHLKDDLYLADVAAQQPLDGEQAATLVAAIAQTLLELVEEQPEASALLRGRTFARTLH